MSSNLPYLSWKIRCFDRSTRQLFDRTVCFCPPAECASETVQSAVATIQSGESDHLIPQLRYLFRELDEEQQEKLFEGSSSFRTFAIPDYFEDETGESMDVSELIAAKNGVSNAIVLGEPGSVLKLGVSELLTDEQWTVENSNDLAHFIQLANIIQRSTWFQTGIEIKTVDGREDLIGISNADMESISAAMGWIRQFVLRRDDAFIVAVDTYCKFVASPMKTTWVEAEKQFFQNHLAGKLHRFEHQGIAELETLTNLRLIDLVVYGSGLFHRASNQDMESELSEILKTAPRERLIFAFHSACWQLMKHVLTVLPVITQDFESWIERGVVPMPTRVIVSNLFLNSSFSEELFNSKNHAVQTTKLGNRKRVV